MKIKLFLGLIIIFMLFLLLKTGMNLPVPTEFSYTYKEDEQFRENRKKWIELMHKAAPGTGEKMDQEYRQRFNEKKLEIRKKLSASGLLNSNTKYKENFRDLSGYWQEKGSNNLAGRILTVFYDEQTDF